MNDMAKAPIGVFDSGYGGLTVFREIKSRLPQYDYIYLGDNARTPYGNRSFETIHRFTWEAVQWLFAQGCPLVILACNTASAKALRTIQQQDLPQSDDPSRRVLGVIRPTTELLGALSHSGNVGILGTEGTVRSGSYLIELQKYWPDLHVYQQACPMWVPLIETGMHNSEGADFFVDYYLNALFSQSPDIDTVLLACTHYPLLLPKLNLLAPPEKTFIPQGPIVAESLVDYLQRHPSMESRLSCNGAISFYTTDNVEDFDNHAATFWGEKISSKLATLA